MIDNTLVQLPIRYKAGDIIDDYVAAILNEIQLQRIRAKLHEMVKKNEISPDELQRKAIELSHLPLLPYSPYDEELSADPAMDEALIIARQIIQNKLDEEGQMAPKNIDTHARALIAAMPEILNQAKTRVEARFRAAQMAFDELTQNS
jgi:hypothetical protein